MQAHNERPGKGVMYEEENKKNMQAPDFKGFLVLEMDYKAGEKVKIGAWMKDTSRGLKLISLSEDNWTKRQRQAQQADKEVVPKSASWRNGYNRNREDDSDVPF